MARLKMPRPNSNKGRVLGKLWGGKARAIKDFARGKNPLDGNQVRSAISALRLYGWKIDNQGRGTSKFVLVRPTKRNMPKDAPAWK